MEKATKSAKFRSLFRFVKPCTEQLDEEIRSWNLNQFSDGFFDSIRKKNNYDVKNIYDFVEKLMRECPFVSIVKDYIAYQKESGYQSIHVILDINVETTDQRTGKKYKRKCPVEIQFRNYTQHLFDEFEHDIRYKTNRTVIQIQDYDKVFNGCKSLLSVCAKRDLQEIRSSGKKYLLVR